LSFLSGNLQQKRTARLRAAGAWVLDMLGVPIRLFAGPVSPSPAARQHLMQKHCRVCHNHEDCAGGVAFEVFDATKARHLAFASRTVPTGSVLLSILRMFDVQAERFGDSTGPLQTI